MDSPFLHCVLSGMNLSDVPLDPMHYFFVRIAKEKPLWGRSGMQLHFGFLGQKIATNRSQSGSGELNLFPSEQLYQSVPSSQAKNDLVDAWHLLFELTNNGFPFGIHKGANK